jgi:hypothetical protein
MGKNKDGQQLPLTSTTPAENKKPARAQRTKLETPPAQPKERDESVRSATMRSYSQSLSVLQPEGEAWMAEEARAASKSARASANIEQPHTGAVPSDRLVAAPLAPAPAPALLPGQLPSTESVASLHGASVSTPATGPHPTQERGSASGGEIPPEQVPITPSARVTRKKPSQANMPVGQPQLSHSVAPEVELPQLEANAEAVPVEAAASENQEDATQEVSEQGQDDDSVPPEFR